MAIYDKAHELAKEIKNSSEYIEFKKLRDTVYSNPELKAKIEEFEKANIKIKAIRLNKNGMPKEHMSFPAFKYTEIVNETWENSELYETFSATRYLFMVYQYLDDDSLIFKKAMFWNVPQNDLNNEIKRVWEDTVHRIKNNKYDNLPKSTESPILHVRPHDSKCIFNCPTPDGNLYKKQCFWFNKEYIKKQIENDIN